MKFTKKIKILALTAATLLITGCGQANIGYVDGNRVMEEAPQIKSVMEEGAKKISELEEQAQAELMNKTDLSEEEMAKAQMDIQRKLMGINQAYATQLKHKMDEALTDIAKNKNLDVVVDSSQTQPLIYMGGVDVTDEVIQKLQ